MNCTQCGTEINLNAKFCHKCGTATDVKLSKKNVKQKVKINTITRKIYKIYKHPSGAVEVIKKGWSWPAFLFTWIWALSKKMWHIGFLALLFIFTFSFIKSYNSIGFSDFPRWAIAYTNFISFISYGFFIFSMGTLFGMNGNFWREKNLFNRGYKFKDEVTGNNMEAAMASFLEREEDKTTDFQNSSNLDNKFSLKKFFLFMMLITIASTSVFMIGTSIEREVARNHEESKQKIDLLQQEINSLQLQLYSGSKTPNEKEHIEEQISKLERSLQREKATIELGKRLYELLGTNTLSRFLNN